MSDFVSMASVMGQIVDIRQLCIEVEFFNKSRKELQYLANEYLHFLEDLFSDGFYTDYFTLPRSRTVTRSKLATSINGKLDSDDFAKYVNFGFNACAQSEKVFSLKTLRTYESELERIWFEQDSDEKHITAAEDYINEHKNRFSRDMTNKELKCELLALMNEENRVMLGKWIYPDAFGDFVADEYKNYYGWYHGKLLIAVAIFVLGNQVVSYSKRMRGWLFDLADKLGDINARVFLVAHNNLYRRGHLNYFYSGTDNFPQEYVDLGYYPMEILPYLYAPNADWFNIFSDSLSSRLSAPNGKVSNTEIIHSALKHGSSAVYLNKPIDKVRMQDLSAMRKYVYNILQPGSSKIRLDDFFDQNNWSCTAKPRRDWDYLPILENEIDVTDDHIVFQYQTKVENEA